MFRTLLSRWRSRRRRRHPVDTRELTIRQGEAARRSTTTLQNGGWPT